MQCNGTPQEAFTVHINKASEQWFVSKLNGVAVMQMHRMCRQEWRVLFTYLLS